MFSRFVLAVFLFLPAGTATQALDLTPPQIEGPYYPRRKPAETDADLTRLGNGPLAQGQVIDLTGEVIDPDGQPIEGAAVEIWQTDHQGIYLHPRDPRAAKRDKAFQSYGRVVTDGKGAFAFKTIVPGRYEGRPVHIHVKVTPPGGPTLTTQLYFKGDPDLAGDAIAAALGTALERVLLTPQPPAAGGAQTARVSFVVKRKRIP